MNLVRCDVEVPCVSAPRREGQRFHRWLPWVRNSNHRAPRSRGRPLDTTQWWKCTVWVLRLLFRRGGSRSHSGVPLCFCCSSPDCRRPHTPLPRWRELRARRLQQRRCLSWLLVRSIASSAPVSRHFCSFSDILRRWSVLPLHRQLAAPALSFCDCSSLRLK